MRGGFVTGRGPLCTTHPQPEDRRSGHGKCGDRSWGEVTVTAKYRSSEGSKSPGPGGVTRPATRQTSPPGRRMSRFNGPGDRTKQHWSPAGPGLSESWLPGHPGEAGPQSHSHRDCDPHICSCGHIFFDTSHIYSLIRVTYIL